MALRITKGAGKPGDLSISNAPHGILGSRMGSMNNAPVPAESLGTAYRTMLTTLLSTKETRRRGATLSLLLAGLAALEASSETYVVSCYSEDELKALVDLGREILGGWKAPEAAPAEAPEVSDGEDLSYPF